MVVTPSMSGYLLLLLNITRGRGSVQILSHCIADLLYATVMFGTLVCTSGRVSNAKGSAVSTLPN